jgi:hypothetical protein
MVNTSDKKIIFSRVSTAAKTGSISPTAIENVFFIVPHPEIPFVKLPPKNSKPYFRQKEKW